jgi:hypothetical protein
VYTRWIRSIGNQPRINEVHKRHHVIHVSSERSIVSERPSAARHGTDHDGRIAGKDALPHCIDLVAYRCATCRHDKTAWCGGCNALEIANVFVCVAIALDETKVSVVHANANEPGRLLRPARMASQEILYPHERLVRHSDTATGPATGAEKR